MSLLTPERVPVKVYKWDDIGAPALNKTANCMINIFKACLVTGYGTKDGAGWTAPFESTGVKVLRPEVSPHTDFYLRLSSDTGTEMVAQVYLNMTDANTGDLKLQCDSAFKYGKDAPTNQWVLIASPRGLFFAVKYSDKQGTYFTAGDMTSDSLGRRVFIQHTGGTSNTASYTTLTGVRFGSVNKNSTYYSDGKILNRDNTVTTTGVSFVADGTTKLVDNISATQLYVIAKNRISLLVGVYTSFSGASDNFGQNITLLNDGSSISAISVGTGTKDDSTFYIASDNWVY